VRLVSVFFLSVALCAASTLARAQTASYEDLQQGLKPVRVASLKDFRAGQKEFEGGAVEMSGDIAGIMSRDGVRTVLLRIDGGTLLMSAPNDAALPALRAGLSIKVLARVDSRQDTPLSILAAAEAPRVQPVMATVQNSADIAVPVTATAIVPDADAAADALPQPPKVVSPGAPVVIPRAQPRPLSARGIGVLRPAVPQKNKVGLDAMASYEADDLVEQQKPAYEALVRRHNKRLKSEVVSEIAEALLRAGYKYNMDPRFLAAIIAVESSFDVNCLSNSGAMGLGQLMSFNLPEAGVKNPWNPTENIFGTAKLLRGHLNDFKSRPNGTLLAVAAYNAGPNAVKRAGYRVPNGAQVQRYVWKVYYRYKAFAPDMF
jgi:soluble lytic murein transglycosylase-like protein